MEIAAFKMERWQSEWEHRVKFNLSESGVHPLAMKGFVSQDELARLLKTKLKYIQTNGTPELKNKICQMYPESTDDNILVTTGSVEANYLTLWSLVEPGDEAVFMLPNYLQIQGLLHAFGASVKTFFLKEENDWQPDQKQLKSAISKNTKFIIITNPNNPAGSILSDDARDTILDLAKWNKAWLISDEVYQGAEIGGVMTPSFWGAYEKTIITNGLSKAYGLPGLRIGWIVGPKDLIKKTWTFKDYTSITVSSVSDLLARIVLREDTRQKILKRTRSIIRGNLKILTSWMKNLDGFFTCVLPKAGAVAFPSYDFGMNSTELAIRMLEMKSILVCPGDHFGLDYHIRFGLGGSTEDFTQGLKLVEEGINKLRQTGRNKHAG